MVIGHGYCTHSFHLVHAADDCYYYYYLNHSFDCYLIAVVALDDDYYQADAVGGDDGDCDAVVHDVGDGGQSKGMQMVHQIVVRGRNRSGTTNCYYYWNH